MFNLKITNTQCEANKWGSLFSSNWKKNERQQQKYKETHAEIIDNNF